MKVMRKIFLSIICILAVCTAVYGGDGKKYVVGFYNVENLFDTTHDEGKTDEEFLPEGKNAWTVEKYNLKLRNIASVFKAMADENGQFHSIIGLAEVENRAVLEVLVLQRDIVGQKYRIVHHEGPDARGIDCALLYRPSDFKLIDSESIPFTFDGSPVPLDGMEDLVDGFRTRDILMVHGKLAGEETAIYVAHLPSRLGGRGGNFRNVGADIIYRHAMAMTAKHPGIKIIVMGDMNDDPVDESQVVWLHARETLGQTGADDFFCPFISMLKDGYGTLEYRGTWEIFDNILVNNNIANAPQGGLHILQTDTKGHYGRTFNAPLITQQAGNYKGTPHRTFSYGAFIGGYSDHYPTYIVLGK